MPLLFDGDGWRKSDFETNWIIRVTFELVNP